jgi:TonB-like protein
VGEAIPLDSPDPNYRDYLERLRQMIQAKMGWPCEQHSRGRDCEDRNTDLFIEFGILKDGGLGFVELRRSSGMAVYDEYSANAIKLASPFPAPPSVMLSAMKAGSTGVVIVGHFVYTYTYEVRSLLR